MKKISLLLCALTVWTVQAEAGNGWWSQWNNNTPPAKGVQVLQPEAYKVYSVHASLKSVLFALGNQPEQAQIIELPAPDGRLRSFRIWQSSLLGPQLANKYQGIRTFSAVSTEDKRVTARLDWTEKGFHAMVFDQQQGNWLVDPYSNFDDGFYISYFRKDYIKTANSRTVCEITDGEPAEGKKESLSGEMPVMEKINGTQQKTYRLALACTGEYAVAVAGANPTKAAVLSAMVTTVNRVTGIYERELAVSFQLIANTDTLIYLDGSTDPYTNSSGGTMLAENQNNVNALIGNANYDIGHVFSTGGGGIAGLGVVCQTGSKARGVTGLPNPVGDAFDVDYVAHEMGHQFGGSHTFNANTGSCSGNGSMGSAYEPGSGSTIMAYAGICGALDNLQQHSDPYFHARSLDQITNYITTGAGAACPAITNTGNNAPVIPSFSTTYNIPHFTFFELTAPEATDADHSELTYCWEQWNRGDFGQSFANTRLNGPTFRSFLPDTGRTRVFPTLMRTLANVAVYQGEKLPDTARSLTFRLTARDIWNGIGSFNFSTDSVVVKVTYTGTNPFRVTSQNSGPLSWTGATQQTITWDVSNTTQPPISATNVDIFLSADSGRTWPYVLAANTPNDGSETITVPNINTTKARIKVKGANNIFFDLNNVFFAIAKDPQGVKQPSWSNEVSVYPVPASSVLNIRTGSVSAKLAARITNAVGQQVWSGSVIGQANVPVAGWASGVYYLQLTEEQSNERLVKTVLIR